MANVEIRIVKDKHGQWNVAAFDNGGHRIASGGAESPRAAAIWLVRHVNRIADETELALIELGFLTEAECELVLEEKAAP